MIRVYKGLVNIKESFIFNDLFILRRRDGVQNHVNELFVYEKD